MSRKNNRSQTELQKLRAQVRRLEHRGMGVAIRVSGDPTAIVARPWFNLTVIFNFTTVGPFTHNVSGVRAQLVAQLGLPTGIAFDIRIREVRLWGPLGGTQSATFYDFATDNSRLSEQTDMGTATSRPSFGYVFPERLQSSTQGSSSSNVAYISFTSAGAGTSNGTAHYLVQFRFFPAT